MTTKRLPIAVLISGGGTTLRNLLEKIESDGLDIDVRLVVSSNSKAGGLKFAEDAGIPQAVLRMKDYASTEAYSGAVFDACRGAGVELVVMGGFLKRLLIPADFVNRVTNIHPGLIPAFCGKGFYGARVHQAVLDYGAKISGCTIHFVDNEYDHGPIIAQSVVDVEPHDDARSLAARVFVAECEAYPRALQWYAEGRIEIDGRRVRVRKG